MNTKKTKSGKRKTENFKRKVFAAVILLFSIFHFPFSVRSQVRPVNDYGAIGLAQLLKRLNTTKSVMMIGAHPDDEDSALLAYLARGENARTAYLSLTRGDGGQNIIGSELFESLGVIRTEELLQARRLDGAEQFFTRAFDYGFSKTLTEAKEKWDEKIILCDTVRAIRLFRPLVVISRFAGTPADGHGQHQYAGYISPLAVKAAADATQCKDSGAAWQVLKFYVEQGFRSTEEPTLKINTGEYDPILGRSYAEIAAEGRSQHRTQEQGGLELKGDRFSGLNLTESKVPKVTNEKSIFDGIDTSFVGLAVPSGKYYRGDLLNYLQDWGYGLQNSLKDYNPSNPNSTVSALLDTLKVANNTPQKFEKFKLEENSKFLLENKKKEIISAIKLASGIRIDALTNKETVSPNEDFLASVKVFYPKTANIKVKEIKINVPNSWQILKAEEPKDSSAFARFYSETADQSAVFNVKIPATAKLTEPYFLEKPRVAALYQWSDDENQTLPFQKPLVNAEVKIEIDGTEITLDQPVEYRYADGVRGEIRRELNVVPKISLSLDQDLLIVPQSEKAQTRRIVLSVTNNSAGVISGEAKLNLPEGLKVSPGAATFNLKTKGEKTSVAFDLTIPAKFKISDFELGALASAGGETFTKTMNTIAYPHIQTRRFYTEAKTKIDVLDLKVAPVKVGYIMGSGDAVPEAIRQMNLPVDLLTETDLTSGDLSKYDTIVVGIRAFETRPDVIANNQRILDYVKNGGNLIVQYQRANTNLFPFPATIGTRVTDENAKVTILDTANPVFNFPNKITDADFAGWVQERNLYAFTTFDQNYKSLLEAHDANEAENKGGLMVADIGKGKYIYCSYAFFRQLPAGVSGAYRLFANLLSLPKAK